MGVTACSEKIHEAFVSDDRRKTFFHGHSYTANPLACTAALASLELLMTKTCQLAIMRISAQHEQFLVQLEKFAHPSGKNGTKTKNLRSLGTILAFEIDTGEDSYLNNVSRIISRQALERGVLIRPLGNTIYIMPPYCIEKAELQKVYDTIIAIIDEL